MRKLRTREEQVYNNSPRDLRPRVNLQINPTFFQLQIPCFMGKSWALGDQTLPLSRGTRNRRQEAVGKQEAQMLQAGKEQ